LLVGHEIEVLSRLSEVVEDPEQLAGAVGRVLPTAIALASSDARLGQVLVPALEKATQSSIRSDPRTLVNILYPLIVPAIRKSIGETVFSTTNGRAVHQRKQKTRHAPPSPPTASACSSMCSSRWDRQFESGLLQRRVTCEPEPLVVWLAAAGRGFDDHSEVARFRIKGRKVGKRRDQSRGGHLDQTRETEVQSSVERIRAARVAITKGQLLPCPAQISGMAVNCPHVHPDRHYGPNNRLWVTVSTSSEYCSQPGPPARSDRILRSGPQIASFRRL
jgi:hypothetical protein